MTPSSTEPAAGRTAAVVLAAGLGTRMRSRTPKILHPLCGRPMLAYVLDAWDGALGELDGTGSAPRPIVVLLARDRGRPRRRRRPRPISRSRTCRAGPATRSARRSPSSRRTRARCSSCPATCRSCIGEQLVAVIEQRRLDDAAIALASVFAADPGELGRVVRSEFGSVERIVEARDASADELETNEVNAGLYAFDATWLRRRIDALTPSASNGELYLTDLVQLAREDGRIVSAVGFEDDGSLDGINDRSQLAQAEWALRVRLNEAHMRAGVTMRDPSTVYVDWGVERAGVTMRDPSTVYVDWAVELGAGRHARAGRRPARRDLESARARPSGRARRSRTRRSARAAASG